MTIKNILIAVGIIAVALLFMPHAERGAPPGPGTSRVSMPRAPYPCESDRSVPCTPEQYQQIAEENCVKEHTQGGHCEIVTNGPWPHAVDTPSDGERAELARKIDEGARRFCDNLAHAGYECHAGSN